MHKIDKKKEQKIVDVSFDIVLFFKTAFAIFETIAGIALFFITQDFINKIVDKTLEYISNDWFADFIINMSHHFTLSAQYLAAFYLLIHGVVKLAALILLWKKVLWSYPMSIVMFFGFIVYQMYEFSQKGSIAMIVFTVIDLLMIILTWLEYKEMKRKQQLEKTEI